MSNLYSNLHNLYQVQKTLRFELKPQGKTKENMEKVGILKADEHRAEIYSKVKKYCDEYHKLFIDKSLSNIELNGIDRYYELYSINNRDDKQKEELDQLEASLRKQISDAFKKSAEYKGLFQKDIITSYLVTMYKENQEKMQDIGEFNRFTTYFTGYNKNRENMYSEEDKSTAISYRLINENLPTFIDNIKIYKKIVSLMPEDIEKIYKDLEEYMEIKKKYNIQKENIGKE